MYCTVVWTAEFELDGQSITGFPFDLLPLILVADSILTWELPFDSSTGSNLNSRGTVINAGC